MKEKHQWVEQSYPNGSKHTIFTVAHEAFGKTHYFDTLGGYDHVEGGFVPFQCRKVLKTEKEARKVVLERAIQNRKREIKQIEAALLDVIHSTI